MAHDGSAVRIVVSGSNDNFAVVGAPANARREEAAFRVAYRVGEGCTVARHERLSLDDPFAVYRCYATTQLERRIAPGERQQHRDAFAEPRHAVSSLGAYHG